MKMNSSECLNEQFRVKVLMNSSHVQMLTFQLEINSSGHSGIDYQFEMFK